MLFNTLALASTLIIILLLRQLVNIFPSLLACLIRWKENINLETSVKLSRDRNILAAAMVIPFCLTVYRFDLYSPRFTHSGSQSSDLLITIGVLLTYICIRTLMNYVVRPKNTGKIAYRASSAASRTFFIILTLLLLSVGGVLSFLNIDTETIKTAMIWISAVIYGIFLLRKMQIFASSYNFITVFLYLCALEIVPTGALVVSAMIL